MLSIASASIVCCWVGRYVFVYLSCRFSTSTSIRWLNSCYGTCWNIFSGIVVVCYADIYYLQYFPDSKVHGANMGPIWGRQDPDGPHVCPTNLAIWVVIWCLISEVRLVWESYRRFTPTHPLLLCTSVTHVIFHIIDDRTLPNTFSQCIPTPQRMANIDIVHLAQAYVRILSHLGLFTVFLWNQSSNHTPPSVWQ